MTPDTTGWANDVAELCATAPAGTIVIAASADLHARAELREWLESSIPAYGGRSAILVDAACGTFQDASVLIVEDPSDTDSEVLARWESRNRQRDRDRELLAESNSVRCYLVSTARLPQAFHAAPDLASLAVVVTVGSEPWRAHGTDAESDLERVRDTLEETYGMTTTEFVSRLTSGRPMEVPLVARTRWRWLAQALRKA